MRESNDNLRSPKREECGKTRAVLVLFIAHFGNDDFQRIHRAPRCFPELATCVVARCPAQRRRLRADRGLCRSLTPLRHSACPRSRTACGRRKFLIPHARAIHARQFLHRDRPRIVEILQPVRVRGERWRVAIVGLYEVQPYTANFDVNNQYLGMVNFAPTYRTRNAPDWRLLCRREP